MLLGRLFDITLAEDEALIFFPVYAYRKTNNAWQAQIHAWVFELEQDSFWRNALLKWLANLIEIPEKGEQRAILERRMRWFLVDNQRFKRLQLQIQGRQFVLPYTGANGHALGEVVFQLPLEQENDPTPWHNIQFTQANGEPTSLDLIACILPRGLSVISDIDDTIKISNVLDKVALLRHTFVEPYKAYAGMADLYQQWQQQGLHFHYISASPWQLYPELQDFMQRAGFPKGAIQLRYLRLQDGSFSDFLNSSYTYKIAAIERILQDFPQRRFILIGDTGEQDPEVYAEMVTRYPHQIAAVLLHHVTLDASNDERYQNLYAHHANLYWKIFDTKAPLSTDLGCDWLCTLYL